MLFGGERPWSYDLRLRDHRSQAHRARIRGVGDLHSHRRAPEVDGPTGRRAVALVHALFESQVAGRPVTMAEIESSAVDAYQREIDEHYGLVGLARRGGPGCSLRTAPGECRRSRSRPRWPTAQRSGSTDSSSPLFRAGLPTPPCLMALPGAGSALCMTITGSRSAASPAMCRCWVPMTFRLRKPWTAFGPTWISLPTSSIQASG